MRKLGIFLLLAIIMNLISNQVFAVSSNMNVMMDNQQKDFSYHETVQHDEYSDIQIKTTIVQQSHAHYVTSIPQFSNVKVDRFIQSYTQARIDYFLKVATKPQNILKQTCQAHFEISTQVIEFQKNYYAIVFSERFSIDKTMVRRERHVLLIDRASSRFMSAAEIIKTTDDAKSSMIELLSKNNSNVSQLALQHAIDNLNSLIASLYLTRDAVVFVVNNREQANHLSGFKEIKVPIKALDEQITTTWHPKLIEPPPPIVPPQPNPLPPLGDGPRHIALTFDDGPHGTHTITILNILKQYNVKATFFMLGIQVSRFPAVAKLVVAAGHEVGNHSWNHEDLRTLSANQLRNNLNRTNQLIKDVTGATPKLMRPPYGALNNTVRANTDMRIIMWNVDPQDWKYRNAQTVYQHVRARARDGSVILLHDIFGSSAEATEYIVRYLVENDFKLMTISQLYGY
jgi:peptidoglycan-N-acetylglucosamine deacetylase